MKKMLQPSRIRIATVMNSQQVLKFRYKIWSPIKQLYKSNTQLDFQNKACWQT